MTRTIRPAWRDFLALRELPDGTRTPLGPFSAKDKHQAEVAASFWPDEYARGELRIEADEKAGAVRG